MVRSFRALRSLAPATLLLALLAACGGHVPAPASVDSLVVSKEEPPLEAVRLADVRAVDGSGCGLAGTAGSYDGALRKLRLRAQSLGADFIHLTEVKEPYHDHQCAHKEFILSGVAYRVRSADAATPLPSDDSERAPAAALPTAPPAPPAPGLRLTAPGTTLRAPNSPAASLTLAARLTAPAFAIWIDESATETAPNGFALRYDRAARRLEVVRYPAATAVSVAAEPIEVDDSVHEWRIVRSADEIGVFLDGKRVIVTLVRAAAPESSFRLEPDQFEIQRLSP